MKKQLAILILCLSSGAFAQTAIVEKTSLSPAEQSIANARKEVAKKPTQFSGYNQLAIALSRRARETSDVTYYAQAEEALKKASELSPNNLESEKIRVWLLLGRHEFPLALEAAKILNKRVPDDILVYGFLTDANAELGNYSDAENAAQWMLNLRPGNLPGMTRAAYLRELFGDIDGAYELMDMAYQATVPTETEDRAWILSQMGHLRFIAGRTEDAENILKQALSSFPATTTRWVTSPRFASRRKGTTKRWPCCSNAIKPRHTRRIYTISPELSNWRDAKMTRRMLSRSSKPNLWRNRPARITPAANWSSTMPTMRTNQFVPSKLRSKNTHGGATFTRSTLTLGRCM